MSERGHGGPSGVLADLGALGTILDDEPTETGIGDDDVAGFAPIEVEDDAELVVDADAVLAAQRSLELLQVVAGRREIAKITSVVEHRELSCCHPPEVLRDPSCRLGISAVEDVLGASVLEAAPNPPQRTTNRAMANQGSDATQPARTALG